MNELTWLREEPKSHAFLSTFFLFVLVLSFICRLGTKTTCSAPFGKEKPL